MDNKLLIEKIFQKIKRAPADVSAYEDLFSVCRGIEADDFTLAHATNESLRKEVTAAIRNRVRVDTLFDLYGRTLLFDAPHFFDPYMLFMELNRKPQERFYLPRRHVLKPVVDAIQDLLDDRLDEVFSSEPPRTGKTTLLMFLITFLIGKCSERSNLYSAYSHLITDAMHNGVLEVINDPSTYRWATVFPNAKIVQTNAQDGTINIDRRKRYPSLTCRSLYGTLNGACDCDGLLIADDLIGGIEEALNPARLASAWSKVDNNLLPRAKEGAKIFWNGTRWSMVDPMGLRIDLLTNDPAYKSRRYRIINLPALDENDESLFDYKYGVGFSTEFYRQRRASFERNNDMASWNAQYMGAPIEREGALFTPGDFRYYNGVLPAGQPDRVFAPIDPAYGGGDFTASPICFQYGNDIYVHDVVYDCGDKRITQPLLAQAAVKHVVTAMQIEANKATESYKDGLQAELDKLEYRLNLTTKAAPPDKAKFQRIFDKAPDIREMMIFREAGKRSKAYEMFMQNVFSYKMLAKNKNDDAPDSLAMAIDMARPQSREIATFKRFF